jgi:hypothetical protein
LGPPNNHKKNVAKFGGCAHEAIASGPAKKFRHKHTAHRTKGPLLLRCFLAVPLQPPHTNAFLFYFFLFLFFPFSKMFFGDKR